MLIVSYLGSNLVSALSCLQMYDLPHVSCVTKTNSLTHSLTDTSTRVLCAVAGAALFKFLYTPRPRPSYKIRTYDLNVKISNFPIFEFIISNQLLECERLQDRHALEINGAGILSNSNRLKCNNPEPTSARAKLHCNSKFRSTSSARARIQQSRNPQ